ncbi:MAG: hypothetical protein KME17_04245 [Cyanosarcina radialis HA8281-LM2]|nr:hypothetical protein [Cyanosarcina radialis HA8281-LM2]
MHHIGILIALAIGIAATQTFVRRRGLQDLVPVYRTEAIAPPSQTFGKPG